MFCSKCGSAVDSNAKFCKKCGGELPKTSSTTIEVAEQEKASFNQNLVNNPAEPKEQKNRKWLTPFLALLAVCIMSTLVYALKFSGSSDAKQPEVASTQTPPSIEAPVTTEEKAPLKAESELSILTDDEFGNIPFSDRVDDNGELNAEAKDFEKNWKGKTVSLKYGGVKISENFVICEPNVEGLNPNSIVTGLLDSREVGGSGGNPIVLKNCHVEKPNENGMANATPNNFKYNSVVTIQGTLVSATGEGGDEKVHTYPALQLEKAISVLGTDEINVSEQGVVLIQLSLNEALYKQYEALNGKDVSITGTLYHSDNGNHYTSVLMDTSAIKIGDSKSTASNLNVAKDITKSKHPPQAKAQVETKVAKQAENEGYEAILSCGRSSNENLNILACFAAGGGAQTELEIKNGSQYGMYKAYNISSLGREERDGLHIHLQKHFSITAQNSHNILLLSLKIVDSKGGVLFQKSASQYGVISVSN